MHRSLFHHLLLQMFPLHFFLIFFLLLLLKKTYNTEYRSAVCTYFYTSKPVDRNYWVNMQSCASGIATMKYDLSDTAQWEFIFPNSGL